MVLFFCWAWSGLMSRWFRAYGTYVVLVLLFGEGGQHLKCVKAWGSGSYPKP